ncbi:DUF7857 domain-containing protein [Halosimplex salinum]|uniref:DUF7857 domain-containing protein n=1 Tax=Halosimplex salinum TaxID=1710538 RepID=UPI000F47DC2B|nr:hypothetical protein [Halosimplex salinum]
MVTLDWSLERSDGVTLVGLVVAADRPARVRVENRLDGPVWPPRRRGQPAAGWDDGAFTGRVPGDGRLTVGYATPAPPAEPPAAVVSTEPASSAEATAGASGSTERRGEVPAVESTPSGVVRALGDPAVPRDAVPVPDAADPERRPAASTDSTEPESNDGGDGGSRRDHQVSGAPGTDETVAGGDVGIGAGDGDGDGDGDGAGWATTAGETVGGPERLVVPGAVRAWLRDVDARLAAADGGRRVEPGDDRTLGPDSALVGAVETDRRALRRVRERVDALLARADRRER